ncbi:PP2C family protein-serine/threonine phosphatase [Amycolatopsis keratiniphila]|uniref:Diguanylate phosphodiesterase n=1 Tax=Amycolatopsis keratiniphila subsp. keratiniphila TaxID=227715 RepID=A0A1W2LNI1_9PSEU|nr:GAF domain-containing SpoIIE family protein phosphatase [Amycolatopsis keratiniphila]OLZ47025.1 diguanylate phosphodiesterase [Amycolatopsis keratiniphila subsp. nogabecina]ONF64659.1 diguanylate phosphodiesterase [Amycolatopsis keratiniphila subsp. keratiniphila]SDU46154.1 GAF domain-containing protein [Amycolatopsis keratiniphila]
MPETPTADDRLQVLEAITDTELGHLGQDKVMATILARVREVLGVDTATVLRHDPSAHQLLAIAASGIEEEVYQDVRVPVGAGFAGKVAEQRRPVVIDHVDETTVVNSLLWERGLSTLLGVPMLAGDELIGVLHVGSLTPREFSETDIELLQLVAARLALAAQIELSSTDRAAAAALQRSLVPARLPAVPGIQFSARYVPGTEPGVGGDWYDLFALPGGRLGIVMGDVAGHGLNAAVIMGRLRSALRAYALESDDPAEVLTKLDRKVQHFEPGSLATVVYGLVTASRDSMAISLAGHLPPVLAPPGGPSVFVDAPVDPPIGVTGPGRRRTVVELTAGAVLAFYTDGLVERRDQLIDVGLQRLAGVISADRPDVVCARVMAALVGNIPAQDDIALLVTRFEPN